MAKGSNYEIKTTIAIDGEKAFKAAMEDANRAMRVHNADLRAMAAEYEYTDDKQRYFAQRAELVGEKLKQQEMIVEALQRAVKESADMYGDAARQTDSYRIQLSNATAKLFDMRKEAENANEELEELGRDSAKIGRQIDRGIGDAAEDTGEKLDSMFERLQEEVNAIRSNTTVSAFLDIGGAIAGAVSNLDAFAESSREYRRSMSFLEQNANLFGIEMSVAKDLFFQMASVTGEVDSSVEALSNLMAAGFNAEELAAAVDLLGGAVTRFPDTLKFESLADGLQETLATGEATGQYAELLERMGVNLEEFNQRLAKAKTAEEDQQIALAYLTENGLATAYQMYKDANGELLLAEEATLRLNDALSGFGTVIDKILAPGKMFAADVIGELATYANTAADSVGNWLYDRYQTNRNISEESINQKIEEGEKLTQMEARFSLAYKIRDWFKNLFSSAGAETMNENGPYEAGFKAMQQYNMGLQEAADAEVTAAQAAVATTIAQMQTEEQMAAAFEAGRNAMIAFGNGIAEGAVIPINNVASMVNQINAMLAQIATPAFGLGYGGISGGNIYLYTQQRNNANNVSRMIGNRVQTKMLVK